MLPHTWLTSLPSPELPIVEEDAALEATLQADVEDALSDALDEDHTAAVDALDARRMSVGAMSGTTAKTSFSQEEIAELDAEVMLDVFPNLAGASDDLAKLLLPADLKSRPVVRKEIRKPGTKYNKLYHNRCQAIALHKTAFGSTEYVQPNIVLRALLGIRHVHELPQGPFRPDDMLYKINLAQMLRTLLVILPNNATISEEGYEDISTLDANFGKGIAGPVFQASAFNMSMSLLTQLAIIRMTALFPDPTFSPVKTIVESFYVDEDDDGFPVFKHANALHMNDLDGDQQRECSEAIQQRVDQLTDMFNEADPASWEQTLAMLRVQYTWDAFLEDVGDYYTERRQQLDSEIAAAGGAEHILSELSKEVERRTDARVAEEKRQSFSRPETTPKKGFGKGGIRALKNRERQLAAAAAALPPATAPVAQMTRPDVDAPEQTAPPAIDDGWMRHEDDELFVPPEPMQSTAKSSLTALSGIQNMQRQNAARGKKSFLDPQPGAVRVSFDDSQSQTMEYDVPGYQQPAQSGPYYESPRRSPAKRTYDQVDTNEDDFDPTQDPGFETDRRDTAAANQRRQALPPPRAPQPRFSSIGSGVPGPSSSAGPGTPSKRARKNPGSSIPPPPRPFDPRDDRELPRTGSSLMTQARTMARQFSVQAAQRRPTQVRTPWSEAEENALMMYIEQEGGDRAVPYAAIKALDDSKDDEALLARRSAEDLRFKARNMKETFIKCVARPPSP